jgi:hypothetical protein
LKKENEPNRVDLPLLSSHYHRGECGGRLFEGILLTDLDEELLFDEFDNDDDAVRVEF